MEKVTFNNMVELRAFCIGVAVERRTDNLSCSSLVATAKEFEKYIVGNATLPEYTNPNAHLDSYIEILSKSMQSMDKSHAKDRAEWDEFLKRMGNIKPFNAEPMEIKE
jgi:hypothetical protein